MVEPDHVAVEGSASLKRSDWGLTWNVALEAGGLALGDGIDLEFDISAIKVDGSRWEVTQVRCHHDVGAGNDRGGKHMSIGRVGQSSCSIRWS